MAVTKSMLVVYAVTYLTNKRLNVIACIDWWPQRWVYVWKDFSYTG